MSTIVFSVIDTACEAADQSFFPPHVVMTTKSTTQIATVLGFSEYAGFESTPPKKFRTLTWEGSAEQTVFGGTTQVAGAKLEWSGSSEIDLHGNYVSTYTKTLSQMCAAVDDKCAGLSGTAVANVAVAGYKLRGWFGSAGHEKCTGTGLPYTTIGDVGIKTGQLAPIDNAAQQQLSSGMVFGTDGVFVAYGDNFTAVSAVSSEDVTTGQQDGLVVAADPLACGTLVLFGDYNHPPLGFGVSLVWNNDYSATLTDEYTDADALAQAKVIIGNGATAQNLPRTTGFTSTFTGVVYTLTATNLIQDQAYMVTVDLADLTAGTHTTKQYPFTADSTLKHIFVDAIATPTAGHTVQVRNPQIQFVT
jgi:hypothetical protein